MGPGWTGKRCPLFSAKANGQIKAVGNADNDQVTCCHTVFKRLEISLAPDGVFASRFACIGE